MTASSKIPSSSFLAKFGKFILVSQDGAIRFTSAGQAELFPSFHALGIAPASLRSVEDFRTAMRSVLAADAARLDQVAEALAHDTSLTAQEHAALSQFFGPKAAVAEKAAGVVIPVDFRQGG